MRYFLFSFSVILRRNAFFLHNIETPAFLDTNELSLTKNIGYHVKFGMQYVNFTTGERYYKSSFFEYVNAFKLYAEDPVVPVYVK